MAVGTSIIMVTALAYSISPVYAHADYSRSEPASEAVVREAPARVHVWFTQELFRRTDANNLSVEGPDGMMIDLGDVVLDDDDRTHLSVSLPPSLTAGNYLVRWMTLSAVDGDEADGSFTFTINPNASMNGSTPENSKRITGAGPEASIGTGTSIEKPKTRLSNKNAEPPWWALITGLTIITTTILGAWALFANVSSDNEKL